MTWEGIIPRKRRKTFEQFLHHDNPRIRACAEEMLNQDKAERAIMRSAAEQDEAMLDQHILAAEYNADVSQLDGKTGEPDDARWITEIPF